MSEINKLHQVLFYRNTADCIDSDHIFKINPIDKHIVANCKSKFNHNFYVNKLEYNPATELPLNGEIAIFTIDSVNPNNTHIPTPQVNIFGDFNVSQKLNSPNTRKPFKPILQVNTEAETVEIKGSINFDDPSDDRHHFISDNLKVENNLRVGKNLNVYGNLTVHGDISYLQTTETQIKDKYISLNHIIPEPTDNKEPSGIIFKRYNGINESNFNSIISIKENTISPYFEFGLIDKNIITPTMANLDLSTSNYKLSRVKLDLFNSSYVINDTNKYYDFNINKHLLIDSKKGSLYIGDFQMFDIINNPTLFTSPTNPGTPLPIFKVLNDTTPSNSVVDVNISYTKLTIDKGGILGKIKKASGTNGEFLITTHNNKHLFNIGGSGEIDGYIETDGHFKISSPLNDLSSLSSSQQLFEIDGLGNVELSKTKQLTTIKGSFNVDEEVTVKGTLNVTQGTSVSIFDSTGMTSLATVGGPVNIASGGAMTTVKGTFNVEKAVTLDNTLNVAGDVSIGSNKILMESNTGNTSIEGTLDIIGKTTITGILDVNSSANIAGDFSVASDKLTVASSSGNTVIQGTVDIIGKTTVTGILDANSSADIAGDFSVASNKLTVASSTGNTVIAGTLNITGFGDVAAQINIRALQSSLDATNGMVSTLKTSLDATNSTISTLQTNLGSRALQISLNETNSRVSTLETTIGDKQNRITFGVQNTDALQARSDLQQGDILVASVDPNIAGVHGWSKTTLRNELNGGTGLYGQVLKSTGTGVEWKDEIAGGSYLELTEVFSDVYGGGINYQNKTGKWFFRLDVDSWNDGGNHGQDHKLYINHQNDFVHSAVYTNSGDDANSNLIGSRAQDEHNIAYFRYGQWKSGHKRVPWHALISLSFTGQHRCVPETENMYNNIENYIGMVVEATGKYNVINFNSLDEEDVITEPTINEAQPLVKLTMNARSKKVFGVISACENGENRTYETGVLVTIVGTRNDNRLFINSIGEGGIKVCNQNGNIENGDFLCSSDIEGIAMKQDDDLLHNYTIGKATMDYVFTDSNDIKLIGCTYHCG